ncbi:hypothetical protein BFP49_22985 [Bacillus licheniformis]|nr:hypothetical protein BFP49_22985 [Bacillus licheniformis]OJT66824.1 hypothetical protein BFP46_22460 [Bacillus licheniformis]OKS80273.1 hypothetical protein BFN05_21850 [Bacillus licheniformis]
MKLFENILFALLSIVGVMAIVLQDAFFPFLAWILLLILAVCYFIFKNRHSRFMYLWIILLFAVLYSLYILVQKY